MLRTGFLLIAAMMGGLGVCAQSQNAPASELKGMPPRVGPSEYQAHAQAGAVTIAADFVGHSVPTPDATYTTEDYVVVEAGLFGSPEGRATLSKGDFSLRINGKKIASPSQPYELVFHSLKDPEWEPPSKDSKAGKTSLGTGGGADQGATPAPVHMPIELRRAMEQRVQKASMLEGDRSLPQAGLLFFEYRGKPQSIRSLELIYSGSAGNATLALQP
uniref:Lipoprotein n=1 Tax=uncultured Acidobacteriota bacterium TaxID=171953 RepID=G8DPN6_9BACT|nr:hypothetical protein LP001_035 [uncultured Acidobacteriota bacterium]